MRVNAAAAWQEATQGGTWCLVSPFLRAAAPFMPATHLRNLDKDCVGISELEYAPINTDFVESGFAHLDRATRTLFGAGPGCSPRHSMWPFTHREVTLDLT